MKNLIITSLFLLVSSLAQGAECVDSTGKEITSDLEAIEKAVGSSEYCFQAVQLAQACAWGSSADLGIAGSAYDVCAKELEANKPSSADLALLDVLKNRCTAKYENESGTMYRSMNAYCHLSSIHWIVNISAEN